MLYMVKKDLYTFRLPVDLVKQINKLTENQSEFVEKALQDALHHNLQPTLNVEDEDEGHKVDYDAEYLNRYRPIAYIQVFQAVDNTKILLYYLGLGIDTIKLVNNEKLVHLSSLD